MDDNDILWRSVDPNAMVIWQRYRGSYLLPSADEREVLYAAYWRRQLPVDSDYSVTQWVEDIMRKCKD